MSKARTQDLAPGQGITWRPRTKNDEPLGDLLHGVTMRFTGSLGGSGVCSAGFVPASKRCHAIGLLRGDCQMQATEGSLYCYYHDKLAEGLCDPHADVVTVEVETFSPKGKRTVRKDREHRPRTDAYPVWPLPRKGYVVLLAQQAA